MESSVITANRGPRPFPASSPPGRLGMRRHASTIVRPLSVACAVRVRFTADRPVFCRRRHEVPFCCPRSTWKTGDRSWRVGRRRARSRRLNGRLLLRRTDGQERGDGRRKWKRESGDESDVIVVIGVVKHQWALLPRRRHVPLPARTMSLFAIHNDHSVQWRIAARQSAQQNHTGNYIQTRKRCRLERVLYKEQ